MSALDVIAASLDDPTTGKAQLRIPLTSYTYRMSRALAITPEANTSGITVSGASLTGANAQSFLDISGTWNTTGTPTALKVNVTNTASNANALLLDLQIGGVSKVNVRKDGSLFLPSVAGLGASLQFSPSSASAGTVQVGTSGGAPGLNVRSNGYFAFSSTTTVSATLDTFLYRDAAGALALRNGTNAQTFNVYNTYTDASNYECVTAGWSSNVFYMRPANAGTGSARLFIPVTGATIVSSLPSAATAGIGARSFVTDATTPVFGSAVVGSGAVKVPVYSDGTNWIVG